VCRRPLRWHEDGQALASSSLDLVEHRRHPSEVAEWRAEVARRVLVDRAVAADPSARVVARARARKLTAAANAFARGDGPQRRRHRRVGR